MITRWSTRLLCCAAILALWHGTFLHGATYLSTSDLNQELRDMGQRRPDLMRVDLLARTSEAREVLVATVSSQSSIQRHEEPGLLAVAGLEGNDLVGSASLLHWLQTLIRDYDVEPSVRQLLDRVTIYIIPRLNPDAADLYFELPQRESLVNSTAFDDDHDGFLDEDGPEDLNGDGQISMMRVKDPNGEFMLDPLDPRLLLKADPAKGERGEWRLMVEGRDNDSDETWNEDPVGGVNLNRNFPYGHRYFAADSGAHPLSEDVTRALAEFVIARPHAGIVFAFGSGDVLTHTPKTEPPKSPPATIHERDIDILRELGKQWRDALGVKKEIPGGIPAGSFASWAYFHRGRLGVETRPWSAALQIELTKTPGPSGKSEGAAKKNAAPEADENAGSDKAADDKRNEEDRAFLKWADEHAPSVSSEWKAYAHPDFPNQLVEIGGFNPFAKSNPPGEQLLKLLDSHSRFLTSLAGKLPRLAIRKTQVTALGNDVFDVVLQIENNGYLPTSLAQGAVSREVHPTRVELALPGRQVLAGSARTLLPPIAGSGGMSEVRWIIHANGQRHVVFTVTSALAGTIREQLRLE